MKFFLKKLLEHPDWRARDAAIEKILRVHGRYIEKFAIMAQVEHTGQVQHEHGLLSESKMTPEMRATARDLLTMYRTHAPRALPHGILEVNSNGNGHHADESQG